MVMHFITDNQFCFCYKPATAVSPQNPDAQPILTVSLCSSLPPRHLAPIMEERDRQLPDNLNILEGHLSLLGIGRQTNKPRRGKMSRAKFNFSNPGIYGAAG